jgi:DNA primase
MDLRELQKTGRIGRIDVDVRSRNGRAEGELMIPSSLDATETALVAAALETVDRIGPCDAKLEVKAVEDVRLSKREYITRRAKEILREMEERSPKSREISDEIKQDVRASELTSYKGIPAGPDVEDADEIVLCEGRADVLNLLRNGVRNAVAVGGTSVPDPIRELSRGKEVTLFLDGDRGGELLRKELEQTVEYEHVARAPEGKEVEELSKTELFKALREKRPHRENEVAVSVDEEECEREKRGYGDVSLSDEERDRFELVMNELVGTRAAYLLDDDLDVVAKFPVSGLEEAIRENDAYAALFDRELTREIRDVARREDVRYVVGMRGSVHSEDVGCIARDEL